VTSMAATLPLLATARGGGSDALFYPLVFLHALAALAGFGSIGFAGTYASRAAQLPPAAAPPAEGVPAVDPEVEELVRYFRRPARYWKAILLVPVLGVLALAEDPGGGGVAQAWDIAALSVWLGAALVTVGIVVPSLGRIGPIVVTLGEPAGGAGLDGPERARLVRAGTLASRGAALCDILFFVSLALMIWRP